MSSDMTVKLAFSWKGPYRIRENWKIKSIDVKVQDQSIGILSGINTKYPVTDEQPLTSEKKGEFSIPINNVRDIRLLGLFSKKMEHPQRFVKKGSQKFEHEQFKGEKHFPIPIDSWPKFQKGKLYQIEIVNKEGRFAARCVEVQDESESDGAILTLSSDSE